MKSSKINFSSYIFIAIIVAIFIYSQKHTINFALLLVIAIIISRCAYLFQHAYLKNKPLANEKTQNLLEETSSLFPLLVIVFVLRSFIVEPFRIPSSSLEPTLQIGDFVAVNKFAYGIRLPVIEKKIFGTGSPKRGDIVVFRWPPNPKFDFIKRVIGLPGDKIRYENKQFFINGKAVKINPTTMSFDKGNSNIHEFIEELPGQTHHIYQRDNVAAFDFSITVPEGHYLVIGDNRDDSADSRFWGFVPDSYLRGQAFGIWMSWDGEKHRIRFNRIGKAIH